MSNQIIIVEGTHDEQRIRKVFPNANCIITNGSEISNETMNMIKTMALTNEIIIFTDPDYPGERIRSKILQVVPNAKNAFIKKNLCISSNQKKVGVEHASLNDIYESLKSIVSNKSSNSDLNMNFLMSLGLNGAKDSKRKRELLCDKLNIGKPNAKTFLARLKMLGITKEELKKLVGDICG